MNKEAQKRKSGISIVGDMPWGSHFCQFYNTKKDLLDILLPYFKAGLENNEYCVWVTSDPLGASEAKKAMKKYVADYAEFEKKGQIEIFPYTDWYTAGSGFEQKRVLDGWVAKYDKAVEKGFDGLRVTGNTFWISRNTWDAFTDYEASINTVIDRYRMLVLCTYSLKKCGVPEIMDVVKNHEFVIARSHGEWQVLGRPA
jgi:hypothetical protein